ncbi:hypothetical protein UFOVP1491_16 [uncultured Caudovirales phage]|uniref:Uncharacterized protein n=1 Tax=uncultured Caudovirales phage TaxID=2100421 RepID=A0A6J5MWA8_9CAUD|nr:hypothetical protein UFOVP485_105 [uncultured Caudovirales phage]CAB4150928.1 hypothetical protein UFOVP575_57 [uncultured Caudovirales phage]CAB4174979.1 hypothetical protein UFOVP963_103 [uncultured Caudovirales phage]CAB4179610.1 hypothetical protein UFOVP1032_16 [uncultured Caudovirales phage]CAB4185663.1 hypothetical protein UFOVP1125_84 [uncultured Caudovirales phage]
MSRLKLIGAVAILTFTVGLIYNAYILSTLFDDLSHTFSMDD